MRPGRASDTAGFRQWKTILPSDPPSVEAAIRTTTSSAHAAARQLQRRTLFGLSAFDEAIPRLVRPFPVCLRDRAQLPEARPSGDFAAPRTKRASARRCKGVHNRSLRCRAFPLLPPSSAASDVDRPHLLAQAARQHVIRRSPA